MSQAELIQRAKQGEPAAIARLLHVSLYTRGIRVKAHRAPDRLQILLEAHQFPDRHHLVSFIHRGIARLESQAFRTVEIYARHPDTTKFIWCDGFDVRAPIREASASPTTSSSAKVIRSQAHSRVVQHDKPSSKLDRSRRQNDHLDASIPKESAVMLGASTLSPSNHAIPASSGSKLEELSPRELARQAQLRLSMQQSTQATRRTSSNDLGWMLIDKCRGVNPFALGLLGILTLHSIIGSRHYTPEGFIAAQDPMMMFLHNINLIIHEAGHPIFGILGQFMGLFGGSLMQVLVPGVIAGYFLIKRQNYAWAIALWWTGQSILDVSLYIKDAQERALPLLGGEAVLHDWHFLLLKMHLLPYDDVIAGIVFSIGIVVYLVAIPFGAYAACRPPLSATRA